MMCSVIFLLSAIQLCLVSCSVFEIDTVLHRANLSCYKERTIIKSELNSPRLSLSETFDIDQIHRNASKCLIRSRRLMTNQHIVKQSNLQLCQKTAILHPFKMWFSRTLTKVYYTLTNGYFFQCSKTKQVTKYQHSSLEEKFNVLTFGSFTSQNLKKGICLIPRRKNSPVVAEKDIMLDHDTSQEFDAHLNLNKTISKKQSKVRISEEWFYHFLLILRLKCQSTPIIKKSSRSKVIFESESSWLHLLTSTFKQQSNIQVNASSHKRLTNTDKETWYKWFLSVLRQSCRRKSVLIQNSRSPAIVANSINYLKDPVKLNDSVLNASNLLHLNTSLDVEPTNDNLTRTVIGLLNMNNKKERNLSANMKFDKKRYLDLKQPGYVRNAGEFFVLMWLLLLLTRLWAAYLPERYIATCDLKNDAHEDNHVEGKEEVNIGQGKGKVSSIPAAVLAARSKLALELLVAVVEISPYPRHQLEVKIT